MVAPILAVDIGNARIKVGRFVAIDGTFSEATALPEPTATISLDGRDPNFDELDAWLRDSVDDDCGWWIGSVNRPSTTLLLDWLRDHRTDAPVTLLSSGDLPLVVELERPDMVGIDRLIDAVAANHLRTPHRAAVVVDIGSAITVDFVSPDGIFCGGAIVPGVEMAARAMHEFTDMLPLVKLSELDEPPVPLGTSTVPAMRAGLYWMAVGAIRELTSQFSNDPEEPPEVIYTGGAGPAIAQAIGGSARLVPHLTLAGIALSTDG
jgi:type III pantothenate kinase